MRRRTSVDMMPMVVCPLILIGPTCLRQDGYADVLNQHPGFHFIQLCSRKSSRVPGEDIDPTVILVVQVTFGQRWVNLGGLLDEVGRTMILETFGKIIRSVASATVPCGTQGNSPFVCTLDAAFDHFACSSMPGGCMSACFRPRFMRLCAAIGNKSMLPCRRRFSILHDKDTTLTPHRSL